MKLYYYEESDIRPRVYCNDGVSLSIQTNQYAYCSPRIKIQNSWEYYLSVEVGYFLDALGEPMLPPDLWRHYRDGESPVWGYVPVDLVKEFIEQHGGEKEMPPDEGEPPFEYQ